MQKFAIQIPQHQVPVRDLNNRLQIKLYHRQTERSLRKLSLEIYAKLYLKRITENLTTNTDSPHLKYNLLNNQCFHSVIRGHRRRESIYLPMQWNINVVLSGLGKFFFSSLGKKYLKDLIHRKYLSNMKRKSSDNRKYIDPLIRLQL